MLGIPARVSTGEQVAVPCSVQLDLDGVMKEEAEPAVMDAVLIGCAQKVEHYEIATYGTLCTWAKALGYDTALKLLKQNIDEEEAADEKLSKLSESINKEALAVG